MRPVRLAVIFDQKIRSGGGYQQALNAALLLRGLSNEVCEPVFFTTLFQNVATLADYGIQAELIQLSILQKVRTYLRRLIFAPRFFRLLKQFDRYSPFERRLVNHKIDLVYFLAPSAWVSDLDRTNYLATVWDLCHRDDPEFPEVRLNRQFESRERCYQSLLPRATAIFVDSPLGKANLIHRYGIDEHRVHIMPFQGAVTTREASYSAPPAPIDVFSKYNLQVPYVFYPAQFWAHKNHVYLLEGLRVLEQSYGLLIGAIFSGGDQGNLAHVKSYVHTLSLEDRVRFVGFLDNADIPNLYRQSIALVMPSYFGPTNLPPLEAFALGVPVLYLDKDGLRDQVGDAGLLMDPCDPGSMASHIHNLVNDTQLRQQLIEQGKARLKYFDSIDRLQILTRVLENFRWRRLTWQ